MKKIIKPPILDRIRNAARALRGKPSRTINLSMGLEFKRCDECKRKDCEQCAYKEKLEEVLSQPNCNDCERARSNSCRVRPQWGESVRINCPLHIPKREAEA